MLYRTINVLSWQWIVSNLGRSKEGLHWAIVKVILWTLLPCTQKETSKLNWKLEPIKKLREFKLKCKKNYEKEQCALTSANDCSCSVQFRPRAWISLLTLQPAAPMSAALLCCNQCRLFDVCIIFFKSILSIHFLSTSEHTLDLIVQFASHIDFTGHSLSSIVLQI